ncbi:hypothetical protein A5698_10315 [Mycobacterium sp. E136]|nr:hypothetical protein A5698_10315 [Mycobacterium sp. E136]OBI89579.1 hypothetical protein A5661_03950 [Mycobacterium asiaticum]OBK46147.1 hypothetical protein A5657_26355 [Mycobacterium kubicae]
MDSHGTGAEVIQDLKTYCKVPRFVAVDLIEYFPANWVVDLIKEKFQQGPVQRGLQCGNRGTLQ